MFLCGIKKYNDIPSITRKIKQKTINTNKATAKLIAIFCPNLNQLINTKKIENMSSMFYNCELLNNINLSNFNTKNVKDMGYLFYGCKKLKKY